MKTEFGPRIRWFCLWIIEARRLKADPPSEEGHQRAYLQVDTLCAHGKIHAIDLPKAAVIFNQLMVRGFHKDFRLNPLMIIGQGDVYHLSNLYIPKIDGRSVFKRARILRHQGKGSARGLGIDSRRMIVSLEFTHGVTRAEINPDVVPGHQGVQP